MSPIDFLGKYFYINIEIFLEMAKRLGIEKKVDNKNFNIKIGTLNKEEPHTIYVESSTFITPAEDKDEYKSDTDYMEKSINDNIRLFLRGNSLFDKNYILSVEIPYERMKKNKSSFLSLQLHFKQTKKLNANDLLDEALPLTKNLFNDITDSVLCSGFKLNKRKKKTIYKENI